VTIWAAISWYSAGPIITLKGRLITSDYVDILGNQVHPMFQMLFPNREAIFQASTARSVQSCLRSMKMHFNIFPGQNNRQN